jgi:hypothetical protein
MMRPDDARHICLTAGYVSCGMRPPQGSSLGNRIIGSEYYKGRTCNESLSHYEETMRLMARLGDAMPTVASCG